MCYPCVADEKNWSWERMVCLRPPSEEGKSSYATPARFKNTIITKINQPGTWMVNSSELFIFYSQFVQSNQDLW